MSNLAPTAPDRWLDLNDLLRLLVEQGRLSPANAEQCLNLRRASSAASAQHPLEFIAAQQLDDLAHPGRRLELEGLTLWLAELAGQPYLRIDPLKIDVAATRTARSSWVVAVALALASHSGSRASSQGATRPATVDTLTRVSR